MAPISESGSKYIRFKTDLFESFTRTVYVFNSLGLSERKNIWAHSYDIAIFLVHVDHWLPIAISVGMTESPEIRERGQKGTVVFLEAIVVVLREQSCNEEKSND